jgi:nitroimidazol reductase NimA-like FMN-containing flavoprotein (pyridoxamine 5'-phosphate oxidase superfamily)
MPEAKLSPRMSEDEIWRYVTDAHTCILTTLRRDGMPIAMPLWFACVDRLIYFRTRGKKLQRIAHDPRASFLVESGERWVDLKAVHLTGRCEPIEADKALFAAFNDEMSRKYAAFGAVGNEMPKSTSEFYKTALTGLVRFTPDARILNWDNQKLNAR